MIRPATPDDAEAIAEIYDHYVVETAVTFEEEPVGSDEMKRRIRAVQEARLPWLVHELSGDLTGYSYASPWHRRKAYRYSVESTVYLRPTALGQGIGSALYRELLNRLEKLGLHRAVGVIALPNTASVRLHEGLGFERAAQLSEVGWKFGRWIDVGWWIRSL